MHMFKMKFMFPAGFFLHIKSRIPLIKTIKPLIFFDPGFMRVNLN